MERSCIRTTLSVKQLLYHIIGGSSCYIHGDRLTRRAGWTLLETSHVLAALPLLSCLRSAMLDRLSGTGTVGATAICPVTAVSVELCTALLDTALLARRVAPLADGACADGAVVTCPFKAAFVLWAAALPPVALLVCLEAPVRGCTAVCPVTPAAMVVACTANLPLRRALACAASAVLLLASVLAVLFSQEAAVFCLVQLTLLGLTAAVASGVVKELGKVWGEDRVCLVVQLVGVASARLGRKLGLRLKHEDQAGRSAVPLTADDLLPALPGLAVQALLAAVDTSVLTTAGWVWRGVSIGAGPGKAFGLLPSALAGDMKS